MDSVTHTSKRNKHASKLSKNAKADQKKKVNKNLYAFNISCFPTGKGS